MNIAQVTQSIKVVQDEMMIQGEVKDAVNRTEAKVGAEALPGSEKGAEVGVWKLVEDVGGMKEEVDKAAIAQEMTDDESASKTRMIITARHSSGVRMV